MLVWCIFSCCVIVLCLQGYQRPSHYIATQGKLLQHCQRHDAILQGVTNNNIIFIQSTEYTVCLCVSVCRACSWDSVWLLEDGVARTVSLHCHGNQSGGGWKGKLLFLAAHDTLPALVCFCFVFFPYPLTFCTFWKHKHVRCCTVRLSTDGWMIVLSANGGKENRGTVCYVLGIILYFFC